VLAQGFAGVAGCMVESRKLGEVNVLEVQPGPRAAQLSRHLPVVASPVQKAGTEWRVPVEGVDRPPQAPTWVVWAHTVIELAQRPGRQRVGQAEATADKPYCSRYRPCDARGHRRACRVAPDREPSDLVTIEYRQDLVRKSPTRIARNTIAPTATNGRDVEQLPTVAQKADPNLILHPPVLADDNQRRSSTAGAVGKPVPVEAETVSVYAHSPMLSAVVRAAPIVLAKRIGAESSGPRDDENLPITGSPSAMPGSC